MKRSTDEKLKEDIKAWLADLELAASGWEIDRDTFEGSAYYLLIRTLKTLE